MTFFLLSFADLWWQCDFVPANQQENEYGSYSTYRIGEPDVFLAISRCRYWYYH